MQYREFGNTGIKLSALGFGAMRIPGIGDGDEPSEEHEADSVAFMHRAFELGVNYLDTARMYGSSERMCGKALKAWRDKVYISTKNWLHDHAIDSWWSQLNTSLETLGVDYIDFYNVVHAIDRDDYEGFLLKAGGMKEVRKARDQGLIKHVCFSSHDKPENIADYIDSGEFEGMTVQYNLLDRNNESVIARARAGAMGVIVMGPVGGGRLAAPSKQIQEMLPSPTKSSAEVALRFVLSNPNVTCAISGMNSMEMVEQNVAVANLEHPLTVEERRTVEDALNEVKRLSDLYCTGCNYCMPCSSEVNIPENFQIMNMHRLYGITDHAAKLYNRLSNSEHPERGKKAQECVECGECEPKCPQRIHIIAQLKEVAKTFKE